MTGLSNTKVLGRAMVNTLGLIILVGFLGYVLLALVGIAMGVCHERGSARNVLYGCTELQTASEFLAQVAQLGGK